MRTILAFILSAQVAWGAVDFTDGGAPFGVAQNVPVSGQSVTISTWVYQTTFASRYIMATSDGGWGGVVLFYNTSSRVHGGVFNSAGSGASVSVTDAGNINRWVHLAIVNRSATNREFYVDGVSVGTDATSRVLPNTDRVLLAARLTNGVVNSSITGLCLLANSAVWSTNLTTEEIASLATNAPVTTIRPSNLAFYAPLSNIKPGGGSGTTVNLVGPPVMLTNTVSQSTTQPRIYR